jgi:NitT/TauT family transport system permease protein
MSTSIRNMLYPLTAALCFCLLWEDLIKIVEIPRYTLPAPSDVIATLFHTLPSSSTKELVISYLLDATIQTGTAALLGFLVAATCGTILGSILASTTLLRRGVYPLANLFQMVPIIALAPLLNQWFGYGLTGVVASATIVAIFPVIANTVDGLRSVDTKLVELFEIYNASAKQRWLYLEFPAALPQIFTGLRISAGLAVIGAVVGELVSGSTNDPPIGTVIAAHLRHGDLEVVFAAILCSALVGFTLFGLVSLIGDWAIGDWHASSKREAQENQKQESSVNEKRAVAIFLIVLMIVTCFAFTKKTWPVSTTQTSIHAQLKVWKKQKRFSKEYFNQKHTEPVSVKILLNWMPEPEFGGIYTAHMKGYDREEGVIFDIQQGGPSIASPQLTATGQVEFGVVASSDILVMAQRDANLVAIYTCFQHSPRALMVHKDLGIKSIEKLWTSKQIVAAEAGSNFVQWLHHAYGSKNVNLVASQGGVAQFRQNSKLSQAVYIFSEPVIMALEGIETYVLPIKQSGYDPYEVVVSTRRAYLEQNPEIVAAVQRALKRGWKEYLKQPLPTNQYLAKLNPAMSLAAMNEAVTQARSYIHDTGDLGSMTTQRWSLLVEQLLKIGTLQEKLDVTQIFWLE